MINRLKQHGLILVAVLALAFAGYTWLATAIRPPLWVLSAFLLVLVLNLAFLLWGVGKLQLYHRARQWLAHRFRLGQERNKRTLVRWLAVLTVLFLVLSVGSYVGFWKEDDEPHQWAIHAFVSTLVLSLAILFWSIGTQISQNEQSDQLQQVLAGRQRVDTDVAEQLRIASEHFKDIPHDRQALELDVFVSSPGFGILGGSEGIKHFREILESFSSAATKRAKNTLGSHLRLFLWEKGIHADRLGKDKGLWVWNDAIESRAVLKELCSLVDVLENLKLHVGPNLINVERFQAEQDELRFILLREDASEGRSAMFAFGPISKSAVGRKSTHSVILIDDTVGGYRKIRDFFREFLVALDPQPKLLAQNLTVDLIADPKQALADFFCLAPDWYDQAKK